MDFYIKRNDTLPVIEYTCMDDAGQVNVADTTIKFCMGWRFYLPSQISSLTTSSFTWPDQAPYLITGDVLAINQERMVIDSVDRTTNTITVTRGVELSDAALHPGDSIVQVLRIESAAALKNDGTDGVVKYEWSAVARDTKMSGRFDAEFEVTFLATGKRQTYPMAQQQSIRVFILDDINVR